MRIDLASRCENIATTDCPLWQNYFSASVYEYSSKQRTREVGGAYERGVACNDFSPNNDACYLSLQNVHKIQQMGGLVLFVFDKRNKCFPHHERASN